MLKRFTLILLSSGLFFGCNETITQKDVATTDTAARGVQKSNPQNNIDSGGIDSGGGNGLFYRLQNALDLSLEVLSIVKPDDFDEDSKNKIFNFYNKNRKKLLVEAAITKIETRPADEVFIIFNDKRKFEKMITKLKTGSTIFVADDLNVTDPLELTANILHELIHHLGFPEEEDDFLDDVALALVQMALKLNPTFKKKVQNCISPEDFMINLDGVWSGSVSTPWTEDYEVDFEFNSDTRSYSSTSVCENCENTPSATYWGTDGVFSEKSFIIEEACGGNASGVMDLYFKESNTTKRVEQRFIKLSEDKTELTFEIYYNNRGPLEYKLQRIE